MGKYKASKHVPRHIQIPGAVYMVTAGTYRKIPVFNTEFKLGILEEVIRERCILSKWELIAWVALPNHYHIMVKALDHNSLLSGLIRSMHSKSAILVNQVDRNPGRRVWYNYWDTCIRSGREYLARVKYILQNPEHHGIVENYREYAFSSYRTFFEKDDEIIQRALSSGEIYEFGKVDDY